MRQHSRKFVVLSVAIAIGLLVPVSARAFIGTMPVIDWTAVVRIGRQIGISQETLNTLGCTCSSTTGSTRAFRKVSGCHVGDSFKEF